MALSDLKPEEITFDTGRKDEHRSTDAFQLWIRVKNLGSDAVNGFSVIAAIDHTIREVSPNLSLTPGEETWVILAFAPLHAGEHTLGVYFDPTPDGTEGNPLEIITPFVPFEFTVHPPTGTYHEPPEKPHPHPAGHTTVVVSVATTRDRPLHGYQTYVQFNGDEAQTFGTDKAGGGSWQNVAIPDTGSAVVWAVPLVGSVAEGHEPLVGALPAGYHVKDHAVRLKATVHEEEMEVEAASAVEAARQVESKVGGGNKILDIVDLSGGQTTTTGRTTKDSLTVKFKVHYTTGDLTVEQAG
jgi:hypothetical protein